MGTPDMPGDFWAGWIAVLTVVSVAGLAWLVHSAYFAPRAPEEATGGPSWDGDLREGDAPAPMWWFWMIFVLLVFSVIYLLLYPGLGSYAGALRWSQGGELAASERAYAARFGDARQAVVEADLATLRADAALMRSAAGIYGRHCAGCHGTEASGVPGHFPNLVDRDWQWGGAPEQIDRTIRAGRDAVMVGWLQVVGESGLEELTDYTLALQGGTAEGHPGQVAYGQFCAACHGADGTGNALLGAPNLTDDTALYGTDREAVRTSIAEGRNGSMPGFADHLDDTQIRLLVAWLTRGP